jgi:hypothetical protein
MNYTETFAAHVRKDAKTPTHYLSISILILY